jgi:hypothetical protein
MILNRRKRVQNWQEHILRSGQNKIPMKIPEFRRSGIELIEEFHGILNGFPNLGQDHLFDPQKISHVKRFHLQQLAGLIDSKLQPPHQD